jgi:hypothetical protein
MTPEEMANARWADASIEEKLEMLRRDLKLIRDAHNALARDFRDQTMPMARTIAGLGGALEQIRQQNEAAQESSQPETRQPASSGDRDGGESPP